MDVAVEETSKQTVQPPIINDDNSGKAVLQESQRKHKRDERKREREDRSYEMFMKSLTAIPLLEDKFTAVCSKYAQTLDDNKKLQFYIKQSDKRHALLQKEKEHLQHEFNKTILVKSKLENLCRELQKQNKAIKEESLLKIREEEERRKETQAKFQNTLSEITTILDQNNEKTAKLRDDNNSMTEKFKSVVSQIQLREQQVDKMAKQMALENQLADAKLQKASLEHQAEKERLVAEMEHLKVAMAQYKAKLVEQQGTEVALKGQLAVYTDKYDEFQNALVKSNQVFGGFKDQMDMMSKKIKKLEKESLSWKKRWEQSQKALLDMCGERQSSEEKAAATNRLLAHMQGLCRTLQAERTVLLNTLKENNIERPPVPAPAPVTPAPPPPAPVQTASDKKVDAMVANCAQLRQSLAHLQSQLNVLTVNKDEPPKTETKKKSKSKKSKTDKHAQKVEVELEVFKESDGVQATAEAKDASAEVPLIKSESVATPVNSQPESSVESENLKPADTDPCNPDDVDDEETKNEEATALGDADDEAPGSLSILSELHLNDEIDHIPEVKSILNAQPAPTNAAP